MLYLLERMARECGQVLFKTRQAGLKATDKPETLGAHFATQGDESSQILGIRLIREGFPHELIIAEEQANKKRLPKDCTVFDPCDGTTNYFNGSPEFGVTLCTFRGGRPQWGVIHFPVSGMTIAAGRGSGCLIDGKRFKMLWHQPLDKAILGTDVGPWTVHPVLQKLAKHFCVHSKMAAIAGARDVLLGITGAYWNINIAKVWDAAAGVLMVEEAGGVASDPWGRPLKWDMLAQDWVMAATPELLKVVVSATKTWKGRK